MVTEVDATRPGIKRITQTVDYLDGLPTTTNPFRRSTFEKAMVLYRSSQFKEAIKLFQELLKEPYAGTEEVALLIMIGNGLLQVSQLANALEYYEKALEKAEKLGDKEGEACALGNVGIVYRIKGELDKALEHYQLALKIDREIGKREGEANQLGNMGIVYQTKGELGKALEHHQLALKIFREIGNRHGEACALGNMGIVYRTKGELDKALEHHQLALKIFSELGLQQDVQWMRKFIDELKH